MPRYPDIVKAGEHFLKTGKKSETLAESNKIQTDRGLVALSKPISFHAALAPDRGDKKRRAELTFQLSDTSPNYCVTNTITVEVGDANDYCVDVFIENLSTGDNGHLFGNLTTTAMPSKYIYAIDEIQFSDQCTFKFTEMLYKMAGQGIAIIGNGIHNEHDCVPSAQAVKDTLKVFGAVARPYFEKINSNYY